MRVLFLDPGEKVGWAHATVTPAPLGSEGSPPALEITGHGITALKDFAIKLHEVAGEYDLIGYETWRLSAEHARKFIGNDFQPVQFIGMVRLCAWVNNVRLVSKPPKCKDNALLSVHAHPQGAQVVEILDRLPKSHDDAHDGDALLHLWHWYWEKML